MNKTLTIKVIVGLVIAVPLVYISWFFAGVYGLLGDKLTPGQFATEAKITSTELQQRQTDQFAAAEDIGIAAQKKILFGDLHVHSSYSLDGYTNSLPVYGNRNRLHPLAAGFDYGRFCSSLDFMSINDHAESLTNARWQASLSAVRDINSITHQSAEPDFVVFPGWEWTNVGLNVDTHYGHHNVILKYDDADRTPPRAIFTTGLAQALRQVSLMRAVGALKWFDSENNDRNHDFGTYLAELTSEPGCPEGVPTKEIVGLCGEAASTPGELAEKLVDWGFPAMIIPHGTTWGFYTPTGYTFDKQLAPDQYNPTLMRLFEVFSGHGNSEVYSDFKAVNIDQDGNRSCPVETKNYLPSCVQAGKIIYKRCMTEGLSVAECESRRLEAEQSYIDMNIAGFLSIPGAVAEDWLDSGQCKDCDYMPSFNYRPGGSVQYALAKRNFDSNNMSHGVMYGFIAASDNHQSRPGTGYKEVHRTLGNIETQGMISEWWRLLVSGGKINYREPVAKADFFDPAERGLNGFALLERERQQSFFGTGGLVAVHSKRRSREEIWEAFERREVYGTSGDRMLLWFDLFAEDKSSESYAAMGSEVVQTKNPKFRVRAVGAFKQKPGCDESVYSNLSKQQLTMMCDNECYNPSDERKLISRIEIIRIMPQIYPNEPINELIQDPWLVHECAEDESGCAFEFSDSQYKRGNRDVYYYARAIQEPTPTINAGNLRCTYDKDGNCIEVKPCYSGYRDDGTDCLEMAEERAWSSPIYLRHN